MKHLSYILFFLLSLLIVSACDVRDVHQDFPFSPPISSMTGGITNKERDKVLRDTITPPDNPMNEVPFMPGTFNFRGVLQLEYFEGELYCVIKAVNNDYFLMDNGASYLFRLDHPLLSDYAIGDTLVVVAEPMKVLEDFSLATYYIQPNK